MKIVQVQFDGTPGRHYSYYCDFEVEVGDLVVAPAKGVPTLVKVSRVLGIPKSDQDRAHSLIIQKVDMSDFEVRTEKLHLMMEIKSQLKTAWEQHNEMEMYRVMAASNPVIAGLLDRLREISPESVPMLGGK